MILLLYLPWKYILIFWIAVLIIGGMMMSLSPNIYWLIPARVVVGFASGLSSVVVPGKIKKQENCRLTHTHRERRRDSKRLPIPIIFQTVKNFTLLISECCKCRMSGKLTFMWFQWWIMLQAPQRIFYYLNKMDLKVLLLSTISPHM